MGYTLIVADDERHIRDLIVRSCNWASLGIDTVLTACDGNQVLELLDKHHVDILLSDIVMPEINGLELCSRLCEEKPNLLLYLLTGYSDFEYARQALRTRVQDYILKPVNDAELANAMETAVAELEHRRNLQQQLMKLEGMEKDLSIELREAIHAFADDIMSEWKLLSVDSREKEVIVNNPTIYRVLEYVEKHISDERLTLNFIATSHLFLNTDYLGRLFKKEMGIRFSSYLLERRIKCAIEYIACHPDAKIYEIADAVGFGQNPSYFSALFRKVTGKGPTEYIGNNSNNSKRH